MKKAAGEKTPANGQQSSSQQDATVAQSQRWQGKAVEDGSNKKAMPTTQGKQDEKEKKKS